MPDTVILASGSAIRAQLLRNANVPFDVVKARVDEEAVRQSLAADQTSPRDTADALAEIKARKVSDKHPSALVIGCDQILDHDGKMLNKPLTPQEAEAQIDALSGQTHVLWSAAVIAQDGKPIWRQITKATLTMHQITPAYRADYVARNWDSIRHSVGSYKLEEEGARLFAHIEGDSFTVLGLPFLPLLSYLTTRGVLLR